MGMASRSSTSIGFSRPVDALNDPRRFGLGAATSRSRHPGGAGIRRLTALGPQSPSRILHAARDPLRDVLVPLNRGGRWPRSSEPPASMPPRPADG